jgi:hypothetical protein
MKPEYRTWIDLWLTTNHPLGRCSSACQDMQKTFPELRLVRGYVDHMHGNDAHWWLQEVGGEVVDPTASQFKSPNNYTEYEEGMEVRIGRCMNCGWDIFDNTMFSKKSTSICSDDCGEQLREYLEDSVRPRI